MPAPKRVAATVRIQLAAGQASPGKVGQALGVHGVNIGAFIAAYNAATSARRGVVVPVLVTVYDDRALTDGSCPRAVLVGQRSVVEGTATGRKG
jgi:large subunit ribosomal protein L11